MSISNSEPILRKEEKFKYLEQNLTELAKIIPTVKLRVIGPLVIIDDRYAQWLRRWAFGDSFEATVLAIENSYKWLQEGLSGQDKKAVEKFKALLGPACVGLGNLQQTYGNRAENDLKRLSDTCDKFRKLIEQKEVVHVNLSELLDKLLSGSHNLRKISESTKNKEIIKEVPKNIIKTGFHISSSDLKKPLKSTQTIPKSFDSTKESELQKKLEERRKKSELPTEQPSLVPAKSIKLIVKEPKKTLDPIFALPIGIKKENQKISEIIPIVKTELKKISVKPIKPQDMLVTNWQDRKNTVMDSIRGFEKSNALKPIPPKIDIKINYNKRWTLSGSLQPPLIQAIMEKFEKTYQSDESDGEF